MFSPRHSFIGSVDRRAALRVGWLLGMCTLLLLVLAPFSSFVAALPFIRSEFNISNTVAGAIFSAYLAGYAVSALLVLPLTDRVPSRRLFLVSAAISVFGNLLFPIVAFDTVSACILRFVSGIGLVGVYMPGLRLIADRFPTTWRGAAMGMYVTSFYTANAASLIATGALMNRLEWRDAYLVLSAASALSIPLVLALVRSSVSSDRSPGTGRLQLGVLKDSTSRAYIIGYSLHAVELYAVRVWLPALLAATLVARGVEIAQAAITAATVGGAALAAGSVGPVIGGAISDRLGRANSAMVIFTLSGGCCLVLGWITDAPWPLIVAVSIVLGWAIAADSSIYTTAVTESADPAQLGSTMAVQAFVGFMGGVVGPVFIGTVLDLVPESVQWGVGFTAVALLAVIAVATLYPIRRESGRKRIDVKED